MADVEEFLASVLPRLTAADTELHNGNAGPRVALWSRNEPVTLFGAAMTKIGWPEIAPAFEWVASRFSHCESFEYEVIGAGASGDLAYIVGVERTTASVGGAAPAGYALRVTRSASISTTPRQCVMTPFSLCVDPPRRSSTGPRRRSPRSSKRPSP